MVRRRISLLQSLVFHAALLALLASWFRAPAPPPLRQVHLPFDVALTEKSSAPRSAHGGVRRSTPAAPAPKVQLSDLGLAWNLNRKPSPSVRSAAPEGAEGMNPKQELGDVDKYFAGRANQLYQEIHARVDGDLVYPQEFKDAFIDGAVTATLVFSKEGLLLRDRSKFESANPFIDVLVKRTLRRVFDSPLSKGAREAISGYETTVVCFFRFAIMEGDDEELRKERNFVSAGHISFFRLFQHSKLQWKAGPLEGLGPIAAGINPDWFVEKFNEVIKGHAKIDPLEKWRDDPEW